MAEAQLAFFIICIVKIFPVTFLSLGNQQNKQTKKIKLYVNHYY